MTNRGNVTILGQETDFEGVMEYTDNLVVTGKFRGIIKSTGALEIDKSAVCEVEKITAKFNNGIVIVTLPKLIIPKHKINVE